MNQENVQSNENFFGKKKKKNWKIIIVIIERDSRIFEWIEPMAEDL